jgi:hypothetical protein
MHWARNLFELKKSRRATSGEAVKDITKGPINVRGTTPGNS